MPQDHPSFASPENENVKLWRYMDLSKYTDLLLSGSLFFPKAKFLGDPFENSTTKATLALRRYIVENAETDPRLNYLKGLSKEDLEKFFLGDSKVNQEMLESLYVSCWHMNDFESAAMWKLYAKSNESICVSTNYSQLKNMLPDYAFLGIVRYVDYDQHLIQTGNVLNQITHKRLSFEHEKEIRAILWSENMLGLISGKNEDFDYVHAARTLESANDFGMKLELDLNDLIKEVYVNPDSDDWFYDVVKNLTKKLGFNFRVTNSSIKGTPIY